VIPDGWRTGEAAVVGLARSGAAAARLLRRLGLPVYASDAGSGAALEAAAARLRADGCDAETGRHDLSRLARASVVVVSPGVPPDAPAYRAAERAGVPIVSELDLAARCLPRTGLIVVTGTKGKSTTSAILARILETAGLGDGAAAGNIGRPLADVALDAHPPAWLAVEASSFQLHDCPGLAPAAGVLTNLSPDHLDRYPTLEAYYDDKRRLFRNATAASRWVSNGDDQAVVAMTQGVAGAHLRYSLDVTAADGWYDRRAGWLVVRGLPLVRRADLQLLGDHNVTNALAAALAAPPETDRDRMADALRSFRALHHRLEPVGEVDGVLWVNDSKSTTVASTRSAIEAMERPVVLLVGGRDKGGDFRDLAPALAGARGVIAYGEAGARIAAELDGLVPVVREGSDFAAIMARARRSAQRGDAVLLAPACSSFDMFANAEERGTIFRTMVEAMR
jgi:UDP-N-acetylmuramoylalanine--D-glutamate ligase